MASGRARRTATATGAVMSRNAETRTYGRSHDVARRHRPRPRWLLRNAETCGRAGLLAEGARLDRRLARDLFRNAETHERRGLPEAQCALLPVLQYDSRWAASPLSQVNEMRNGDVDGTLKFRASAFRQAPSQLTDRAYCLGFGNFGKVCDPTTNGARRLRWRKCNSTGTLHAMIAPNATELVVK